MSVILKDSYEREFRNGSKYRVDEYNVNDAYEFSIATDETGWFDIKIHPTGNLKYNSIGYETDMSEKISRLYISTTASWFDVYSENYEKFIDDLNITTRSAEEIYEFLEENGYMA